MKLPTMEDKKENIIAGSLIVILIIIILVTRFTLKHSTPFFLVLAVDTTLILAIFACLLIRRTYNLRTKFLETKYATEGQELRIEYSFLRKVAGLPTKFSFEEIEEATDGFCTLLGQGSSASVFKGILKDGTMVAVKRINREERGDKEFRSEVSAIASVHHVNLVRLLGYCSVPTGHRYLVYEFIPKGSLACWIFPKKTNQSGGCLSWDARYRVAIDVAKGLSYLHHDCRSRVLHLDVKPENILLNEDCRAVVADFGLSKLMGKEESRIVTTIRGTKGYLAPEWLLQQGVSEKSDIYSFGMVLLEMIGGRRNVTLVDNGNDKSKRKWVYFPKIAFEKMKDGKLNEIVDERLIGMFDEKELKKLVYVALWCIQEKARLRPTMKVVVEMLEGKVNVDEPPETQMIVVDLLSIGDDDDDAVEGLNRNRPRMAGTSAAGARRENFFPSFCSFNMSIVSPR